MAIIDKSRFYENLEVFYKQIDEAWDIADEIKIEDKIENIIIAGSSGSIIAGHILRQYLNNLKLPVYVCESYKLTAKASKNSLVFVLSYGNDSHETVSMYRDALKHGAKIITIDSRGKLQELSKLNDTKFIRISDNYHPNINYGVYFFIMLKILQNSNIIEDQTDFVKRTRTVLRSNNFEEITVEFAEKIKDKIILIYSSEQFESVACKWKNDFNKNAKTPSFYGTFPQACYNDLESFSARDNFYVLIIKSDDDDKNIKNVIEITKDLIRGQGTPVTEMAIKGDCYLTKLFSACLIGDWLSYNISIKKGIDPSSTLIIDEFNKLKLKRGYKF